MKKYIRIVLRDKKIIYLPIEKWQSIIQDPNMFVAFTLENEKDWTGRTLNKLEVMYSEYDHDYTQKANEKKYTLYRNNKTNSVVKMIEGELPDDIENYDKI